MNWLLIATIGVVALCGIIGWFRGFIKTMFSLVATLLALVLAAFLCGPVSKVALAQDSIVNRVKTSVSDTLKLDSLEGKTSISDEEIDKIKAPDIVKKQLKSYNDKSGFELFDAKDAKDYVSGVVANIIIRAAVFVVLFIVLVVLIHVIGAALNLLSKLPGLNLANKAAGMAIGLVLGAAFVLVLFALVTVFSNTEIGQSALKLIEDNGVLKYIYEHNIVNDVFIELAGKIKK